MPELPEVETVVRGLRAPLIGRTVQSVWSDHPYIVKPSFDEVVARLPGQTFRAITRRAKYIVCHLDHDLLLIHLKMTGRLYVVEDQAEDEADRWLRFKLQLDCGQQLRFSDVRKFGRVFFTHDINTVTGNLGPEPLEDSFTFDVFRQCLQGRQKVIKALLLDQTFIAGVGNIYADEALFRARIHPLRRSDSLKNDEIAQLYTTIRETLNDGIDYEGASVTWYRKPDGTRGESQEHFYVYGRENEPCLICGAPIVKTRVAQRGTHFCPTCQLES
jgi:formamidopyrimidine-DNA glycosylase